MVEFLVSWAFSTFMDKVSGKDRDASTNISIIEQLNPHLSKLSQAVSSMEIKIDEMLYLNRVSILDCHEDIRMLMKRIYYFNSITSHIIKCLIMDLTSFQTLLSHNYNSALDLYIKNCWNDSNILRFLYSGEIDAIKINSLCICNKPRVLNIYDYNDKKVYENKEVVISMSSTTFITTRGFSDSRVQIYNGRSYGVDYKTNTKDGVFSEATKNEIIKSLLNEEDNAFENCVPLICNKKKWGRESINQFFYVCETCEMKSSQVLCQPCFKLHHNNHKIAKSYISTGCCDCRCLQDGTVGINEDCNLC